MLGKRPRTTTLRTSSVFSTGACSQFRPMETSSRLRDRNCSHDAPFKPNSVASTVVRQVIGFNPTGNGFSNLDSGTTLRGAAAQQGVSPRGPKSPRSALQDLLAGTAREGDPNNVVKPSTRSLPKKENEVISSEAIQQAGGGTDRDDPQSLDSKRIEETQAATSPGQASPQLLHRTKAIGFAAVLVESHDNPKSLYGISARISHTRDHRLQHASASKGCRRKQYGGNSLFLCLAASPSASDHSTDLALTMDFLSSCYLCRRRLTEEKDVFMYNGDKAFCSEECRYRQIVMDERKEQCPPAVIRSGSDVSVVAHHAGHHQTLFKKPTAVAA